MSPAAANAWQQRPAATCASRCRCRARGSSASPIVRGFRTALPPREALILVAVINHPWLLEHHAEEFAELEFLNPDADQLRRAILDAATDGERRPTPRRCARRLRRAGLTGVLDRVEAAITHTSDWPARAGAAADDVAQWWTHVVTLHRKQRTLNKELKDAERALGEEPSDANLAWLRDVQRQAVGPRRERSPDRGLWRCPRAARHAAFEALSVRVFASAMQLQRE